MMMMMIGDVMSNIDNKDERLDHRVKKVLKIEFSISPLSKLLVLQCFIMRCRLL